MSSETLDQLFRKTAGRLGHSTCPFLEARLLIQVASGLSEADFFRHLDSPVKIAWKKKLERLVRKRLAGWPVAYLLGRKEFWSLEFKVNPAVLIPRPETEVLVEKVLSLPLSTEPWILDVGTGCGNIAIALARELPRARIVASDVLRRVLNLARENAKKFGLKNLKFVCSDLLDYFIARKLHFEVIVSNPPYVSEKEWGKLEPSVRDFEPRKALVAGPTGFEIINRLIALAPKCLKPGGYLVFEFGARQEKQLKTKFDQRWSELEIIKDYSGIPRVFCARFKAAN